uniref:Ribosomal protein L29 n=1 Tax=Chondria sp. (in: red algae) TaxID=1982705 RepID=A0A1Z1MD79_9FLOR|nr:ribosomal protein L29 [Chondria sp. (in: red algae)]
MRTNKKLNYRENNNKKLFKLQQELVILRVKQRTKQKVSTHLFKKIKYQISKILTSET